jgi:hypothetical protein
LAETTLTGIAGGAVEASEPDDIRARVRAYLSLHLDSDVTDPFANAPHRDALIRAKVLEALTANGWSTTSAPWAG